eukprot:GHRR01036758.1.p1 GENE.GHRR01036758.1~~GHRR01036758.1.p1  ORF type:complete len:213 (+),score=59.93 GHRR01036758.1:415-1053(+)
MADPIQEGAALQGLHSRQVPLEDGVVQLRYSKAGISSLPPSAQVAQPLGSTSISQCGLDPHNSSQEQPCSCMEPGRLSNHDPVLLYMQQLDEHKKRCELTGRYAEAAAAAARIQDLKSAQGQRMHGELVSMQHRELSHLQQTYQQVSMARQPASAPGIRQQSEGCGWQLTQPVVSTLSVTCQQHTLPCKQSVGRCDICVQLAIFLSIWTNSE